MKYPEDAGLAHMLSLKSLIALLFLAFVTPAAALDGELVDSHWPQGPATTTENWSGGGENLLFVGAGAAFKIYDVSTPSSMTALGEVAVNDPIWHIDIDPGGDLAAISDRGKWVRLIDISNRSAPTVLGRYEVEDGRVPYGLAISGDLLIVSVGPAGVWVIDIADPTAPTLAGQYIEPGTDFVFDLDVLGTYAYVADDDDGVSVIDFSNPAMPTLAGRYAAATDASHISIDGTRAFVSRRGAGFVILDLTMPTAPTLIGTYADHAYRTEAAGDYAVVGGINGVEIIDITNPAMPTQVGTAGGGTFSVSVDGTTAFAVPTNFDQQEIQAIDFQTATAPVEIDSVLMLADSQNVEIAGDVGLVANGSRGVVTLDLNASGTLDTIGRYETDNVRSIATVGTAAIIANFNDELPVIDFSDPAMPTQVGTALISGVSYDLKAVGNLVYVAANAGGLRIVDLTDPAMPVELGSYVPMGGGGTAVSVGGSTAFLTSNTSGWAIDISDPAAPVEIGTFSMPATSFDSDVEGDHLYVAHQNGVTIFDVSNPASPTEVGFFSSSPTSANGVEVVGDRLYIAADTFWGLLIADVSDPTSPVFLESVGTPGEATRVASDGERLLIADGGNGVRLLSCAEPPLFADGFESGDTSSWSATVQP
ncbi:MAG: hypothetical protein AAGM22_17675 [Acidobacteriota bacterium]